ncbi:DNA polymerase III subunit beta [Candidatus Dojkabacteria bacterium]|jgi:DNA polymerase-3 subunit beta|nr:DNA polymerase III subunit beta [Candidatus Dojkabacteria bacterium]
MQFSCNQDTFSQYLNVVSRIVNSKPGLPILNNILFNVEKGKLTLIATDLEIGINCWIGVETQSEGSVTVPAKQLAEFINTIPSERVDIELVKQVLNVSTVKNFAEFHTIPADDFPKVVSIKKEKPLLQLKKDDLLNAVKRVAFAAANDDVKPVLTGVRIEIEGKNVAFVAADGLRLSRQTFKLSSAIDKPINLLVPVKALLEVAYVVSEFSGADSSDVVAVYLIEDRNQVLFKYNDIDIVCRLIDGQFPEYKQILPTAFKTKTTVNRESFANSLKVINIIARSVLGNKIILDISSKENSITMNSTLSDVGSNKSVCEAEVEGDDIKMAFSARFIGDMLNNINGEEIEFESSEPVKPGVFKIKGDDSFIHLIMPMML